MSAIFADSGHRSRTEPEVSATHPIIARSYARGFDAGNRYGSVRSFRYGVLCGVVLCALLGAAACIAVGAV